MRKIKFPKEHFVYILLSALFVILTISLPRRVSFNYDYQKGSKWNNETLVAQFDFPILKTGKQMEAERKRATPEIIPYYKYDDEVADRIIGKLKNRKLGDYQIMLPMLLNRISEVYKYGVLMSGIESNHLYIKKDDRVQKYPFSEVYIIQDVREDLSTLIRLTKPDVNPDTLLQSWGFYEELAPNLIFDEEATANINKGVVDVSPTSGVVTTGTVIVTSGETVTEEIQQVLDSYKAEYSKSLGYDGPLFLQWVGNALVAFVIVCLLFLSILFTDCGVFKKRNELVYLLVVFLMSVAMALIPMKLNPDLLFIMPFSAIALFMPAFFKKRVVLPVYTISLLPLLYSANNGAELFICFFFSGAVCILTFSYLNRGWKQFLNAACVFASVALVWLAFRLMDGVSALGSLDHLYLLLWGSLFTIAVYPLIYLFEKIFMLVSDNRLQELSDGNTPLLRELSGHASGTSQHSLQVMNMCDAAARAINANVELVRAGAMYHDIGKLLNPQCFVENQIAGSDYHATLSPEESAKCIIKHVTEGYELAKKEKLPDVVSDFIITHHGTTCTEFFYDKYVKAGGDPANREQFCYKGKTPETKEQVILMLCDSLEAASRTLKNVSEESISDLVERITSSKMDEGQFVNADITLKELTTVKKTMVATLMGIYHGRIAYPTKMTK